MNSSEHYKKEFMLRLADVSELIDKTNKATVLIIQQLPDSDKFIPIIPYIRESISAIICFVEIGDIDMLDFVIKNSKGTIDKIILDIDRKRENSEQIIKAVYELTDNSSIGVYSDLDMWGSASVDFISCIEKRLNGKKILLTGNSFITPRIALKLLTNNADLYFWEHDYQKGVFKLDNQTEIEIKSKKVEVINNIQSKHFDLLVGTSILKKSVDNWSIYSDTTFDGIFDIGLNNFNKTFIANATKKGSRIYRFDNRAGISSVVLNLMETDFLINNNLGKVFIKDIPVVSGGVMAEEGSVVVDNAFNPNVVLGVSNGEGLFKTEMSETDIRNVEIIRSLIS